MTTIGDYAFYYCDSLTSVTIGNSVTTIGDYAFAYCDSLTGIHVDKENPNYSSDDWGVLFDKLQTTLIQAPGAISGHYNIPNSVTTIGDRAFYSCDSLTSVPIPDSVTTIGDYAFYSCDSLTSVTIGNSVTTIGDEAFYSCDSLTSVTIGNSVTTIGDEAFYSCDSLTSVTIGNSVTTIGDEAFYSCDSLTSVTIGNSVTTIGDYAFYYCSSLTDVYYAGTEDQWKSISIGSNNEDLLNANIHYNATNTAHAVGETIGVMSISESIVHNSPYDTESAKPFAVYPGDYSTEDTGTYLLKTASFTGLVPGQQYILLALQSLDAENLLSADNLLYIYQAEALEDGTLTFQYHQPKSVNLSYVMACGASNKNLSDAQITFPEMTADGTLRAVNPTVVYDGKTLTEGKDYVITGVVDYTEAGEYVCYIRGIYNYTGLVECHYTVEPGETEDILLGDVNSDGKVNGTDTNLIFRYVSGTAEFTDEQLKAADVNGDGKVNGTDTNLVFRFVSGTIDSLG